MRILEQKAVEALIDQKLARLAEELEAILDSKTPRRGTLRHTSKGKIMAQMSALQTVRRHLNYIEEPSQNTVAVEWLGV